MAYTKKGIAPPDPTTPVGQFRLSAGDSEFEPAPGGYGLYQIWSDDEILAFLAMSGGSVARAIGMAYAQIGASWASVSATVKTDDLSLTAKDSIGNWMTLAAFWNKVADDEAAREMDDYFDLVPVGGNEFCRKPEAAPWPVPGWNDPTPEPDDCTTSLDGGTP